jgi:phosphoserine phosphatase RsbU/P
VFKKLSVRLSIALTVALTILLSLFTIWIINLRTIEMNRVILEKGATAAISGARTIRATLDGIIDNGFFTVQQVFDYALIPIHMPENIINGYKEADPQTAQTMQMYHYSSGLDSYLENILSPMQEAYMIDPQFAYAVLVDVNGYVPVHNTRYNKMPTGDFNKDRAESRSKRIYNDEVGLRAVSFTGGAYLHQHYRRDTGDKMWDISAPVYVKGHHWGAFRVGFSMAETEKGAKELRNTLIVIISALLFVCIFIIWSITEHMMKPLGRLHDGIERIAKGDLSFLQNVKAKDEIGDLARAFDRMSGDLAKYLKELAETISAKERIQSELEIATEIQNSMLPRIFPAFPERKEFDIRAIMEPSKEIGGDMYDFFFVKKDKLYFLISDISGKGIPAALYMVITKTLLKNQALQGLSPDKILANVNNILFPDNEKCMFATAFCGIIDINTGEIEFSNAGHNYPIITRASGACERLGIRPDYPIGIYPNTIYELKKTSLKPGDTLFMYTDGVTEAMNASAELFGEERLIAMLAGMKDEKAFSVIKKVRAGIFEFVENMPQSDDITILVLKYFG